MKHYTFPDRFRALHDQAVARYAGGVRSADALCTPDEKAFLAANGISPNNLFDYAEDFHGYDGQPGPNHALGIELVRRDYFLNVQGARPSATVLDPATMPAKTASVRGISWLPRLLPKARAKLRGELPTSLMYGCGGDRSFFQEHDIIPAEFLALVWRHERDDDAIVDWVVRRSAGRR
ncbi:MAG: DUF5069 domain-containing protein [Opitutaceae bacterium]|nr:DUF5069 domain-containing protein [Opitutaceae bacterium]